MLNEEVGDHHGQSQADRHRLGAFPSSGFGLGFLAGKPAMPLHKLYSLP